MMKRLLPFTVLLLILASACESAGGGGDGGIDPGVGSQNASDDVTLGTCETNSSIVTCDITIVNHSDGRSDYFIEATIEDSTGAKVGTANTFVSGVEGGQTARDQMIGTVARDPGQVRVRITTVQRTAS